MDEVRRRGSPARMAYMKRFLSFILCVVLVAGLLEPPKAEAALVEGTLVVSAGVAAAPVLSVLCTLVLTAVGVDFVCGVFSGADVFGSPAYDVGLQLGEAARAAGGAVWDWFNAQSAIITDAGGFSVDWKTTVPKEVAEFARQWAVSHYFSDASELSLGQSGFLFEHYLVGDYSNLSSIILPLSPYVEEGFVPVGVIYPDVADFGLGRHYYDLFGTAARYSVELDVYSSFGYRTTWRLSNSSIGSLTSDTMIGSFLGFVAAYDISANCYRHGLYNPISGAVSWSTGNMTSSALRTASGVATASEELTTEKDKDFLVHAPSFPYANVGGLTVPIIEELTWDKVRDDAGAVEKPDVGTGEAVGDIALEDIQAQEQALGMVFISKFPFSIPWDVFKAVQLLAAPAEAPYWEVDFLAPMEHRVGAWQGDTTVVIDMGEYPIIGQVCRWASTFMFVWALMLGTKRLIWTA